MLKNINLSNNPKLKVLECENASITKLDLSKLPALEKISIDKLLITELDVSHNPALKEIVCRSNDISELDVSHNPELRKIYCKGTNIKKLDVTNTKVDYMECERDCEVIGFKYNCSNAIAAQTKIPRQMMLRYLFAVKFSTNCRSVKLKEHND